VKVGLAVKAGVTDPAIAVNFAAAVNSTAVPTASTSEETCTTSDGWMDGAWPAGMLQEARREKRTRTESKTLMRMNVILFGVMEFNGL
jgi:hypothetical protein